MFHVDNNSGVSAMPPVGAVQSSAPRWFTEGGGGVPASYPGVAWFNILQAELLNFLSAYGITPDKSDLNQLQKAIEEAISQKATANSALLTAIAALVTSANKMPYFTGKDKVAMTDLTAFARTLLSRSDAASVLSDLGLSDRLVFDISGTSIQSPNGRYTVFANDDGTWGAWDNVDKRQVPLDLTRGGFGGINAAEARTNLGLKAAAQRDVGTGAGQIPDMSSFGATKNGTGTFYLPNGIIVKWGTAQSTGTKGNAPYPTPFPNDTYAAIICHASASDSAHYTAGVMNPSRLGFDFSTAPTQSTGASFYYIAIGY